ncbi:MAG: ABC transporter ATP-binding protein [Planctomycetota bacterium]|nr:ABC transporter ATP-binding protein [Planctomycetota bacterium]
MEPTAGERPILVVEDLEKTYSSGATAVAALRGVSFELSRGDFVCLQGPSGCGKTTLLHLVGGMDRPTAGRVVLDGTELTGLREEELARVRRTRVGFVFPFFNLLPTLTVRENVALPLLLGRTPRTAAEDEAATLLERVGLGARSTHLPGELSGGEMQRAAVARAVVARPSVVLADEPTGSLDSENGRQVMELLSELNRDLGITLIVASHSSEVASCARRRILLRDGLLEKLVDEPGLGAS